MTTAGPELSVVIPTYRRPDLLRLCIESLDRQVDAPPFEAVVVDDGSGDATPALLADLATTRPWLQWQSQPANRGPASARNRALDTACGGLILFLDDDIVASPDLLRCHADLHRRTADPTLAILGRVDWHPDLTVTPFMRWLDRSGLQFAYDTWLREGPVAVPGAAFYTANLSMRRSLVVDAGGFDERFPFPAYEDLELATRLTERGLHLDYRPAARAFHRRAIDLATFRRRMADVGESAELMRAVSPGFAIDDRALVAHHIGRRRATAAAVRAKLHPTDATRGEHFWATVAASYDDGRRRASRAGGRG